MYSQIVRGYSLETSKEHFLQKIVTLWYDKQKELERNPYHDILEK